MKTRKNISIVGGRGQMGQLFAGLLKGLGHNIKLLDKMDWGNAANILHEADLVLVSVPICDTENIIRALAPYIPSKSILADLTSIKARPLQAMLEVHSGPVLGLHPMFGPTIDSPDNQSIICCEGRMPQAYQWLIQDLQNQGFVTQAMSAEQHDKMMDFVQGLEHFNTIALGSFLQEQKMDIKELNKLASPIYRIKLLLLGRIFDQDPGLYADILMADNSRVKLIEAFIQTAQGLVDELKNKDRQAVIQRFKQAAECLGDFTKSAQGESDILLNRYYTKK